MKIRDLPQEQINELKNCFHFERKMWAQRIKDRVKAPTEEEIAQHFFSRGVSAVLAMEEKN